MPRGLLATLRVPLWNLNANQSDSNALPIDADVKALAIDDTNKPRNVNGTAASWRRSAWRNALLLGAKGATPKSQAQNDKSKSLFGYGARGARRLSSKWQEAR